MSSLFEKTAINNMALNNRFVRSATFESMANPNGSCTPDLIRLTRDLAEGEVGLIITGYAYTSEIGKARPNQTGVHNDSMLDGLKEMVSAAHAVDGAIVMQIAHCGCNSFVMPDGEEALGPSPISMPQGCRCRDMTAAEIKDTIDDFVSAAIRVKNAGFDGVQLHGAHGYLISQFLSPFYNKRTDEYGGSVENRARFLLEILREIRFAIGPDYPVMVKINSDDFLENGFVKEEMIQVAIMLEQEGIDAIEISGGTHLSPDEYSFSRKTGIVSEEKELYFKEAAGLYKEKIKVPLMLVGGIRSLSVAKKVVDEGLADYVSLCRPLIREPQLIRRWKSGDIKKATCISCNECFKPVRAGKGLYCVAEAKLKTKRERK
jgi:2,4-dienoyl-CoA reductase-like NADH-dependent reductase (Old Yellow Enzyme family)